MRTNWKFPVYFGALVLALTATVVSCSKDSTAPQGQSASANAHLVQQKAQDAQASYKWPGKYHTDALAHVYSKLAQANKRGTKAEKCRVAIAALKEFDKSFRKDAKSTGVADAFLSDEVCGPPGATGDIPQFGGQSGPSPAAAGFSPLAASMLDQIRNITSTHTSSASIVSTVAGIQNSAAAKLNPAEAGAVTASGSVAISSAEYWDANADNWRGLSSTPGVIRNQLYTTANADGSRSAVAPTRPRTSISAGCCEIGYADVTTFISSLLYGWWSGIFDLEQAAVRATIASIIAALRLM
jgi:hypothetical protein